METLVIYRKTGASGTGSWVVHSNILDAFPGTASAEDVAEVSDRVADVETALTSLTKRVSRLDRLSPPVVPRWSQLPLIKIEAGTTGVVFNFAPYITDPDSLVEDLYIVLTEPLPPGLSIVGLTMVAASVPVAARHNYGFRIFDESGQFHGATAEIIVYAEGSEPLAPPIWAPLPSISIPVGNEFSIDVEAFITDADTPIEDLDLSGSSTGSGVSFNNEDKRIAITGVAAGSFTLTATVTDPQGNVATIVHPYTVAGAPAPSIDSIPSRSGLVGLGPVVVDLNAYARDQNTPLGELGTSLSFSNAPAGTTKGGTNNLVLTIPTTAATVRVVTVTITNRAGLVATRSFDLTIFASTGGGGGGDPPDGPGDRLPF
jgi:hypothetical protein